MEIETGVVQGRMARRALAFVREWRELPWKQLLENWRLATTRRPLGRIEPLE